MKFFNIHLTIGQSLILKILPIIAILLGVSACKNVPKPTISENGELSYFGAKIDPNNSITVEKAIEMLDSQEEISTKVSGKVKSVCKKKGCWVVLEGQEGSEFFVKFKDYGFFLPLDCEGSRVVMEGKAYAEVTSVDELRHYAEDEGKSEAEIASITSPETELKFMADGVILYN